MKTISSDYIKEIKEQIRVINDALKRVQETTVNAREYEKAKNEAIDASLDVMVALEFAVTSASNMGCSTGAYDIKKFHKVIETTL
jgi:hypothetical protein